PALAARLEKQVIPSASAIAAARPLPRSPGSRLLIESFGSPFSPLNESQLQIQLIKELNLPAVIVGSSVLGAIGRMMQTVEALRAHQVLAKVVVLIGPPDDFAVEQLEKHQDAPVFALSAPLTWDQEGLQRAAASQQKTLQGIIAGKVTAPLSRQAAE